MSREAHARFCERVRGKFPRSTRPLKYVDPLGLEKVTGINCIGYACGVPMALGPGKNESLKDVMMAEGFDCKPMKNGSSVNDCECPCASDRTVVVFLENVPRDVFAEKGFGYGSYGPSTDYHAMVNSGGGWKAEEGLKRLGEKALYSNYTPAEVDGTAHAMKANYKYCCCKGAGGGGSGRPSVFDTNASFY